VRDLVLAGFGRKSRFLTGPLAQFGMTSLKGRGL
jgi:hypothetical protein